MFILYKRNNENPSFQEEANIKNKLNITSVLIDDLTETRSFVTNSDIEAIKKFVLQNEQWLFRKTYSGGLSLPPKVLTMDEVNRTAILKRNDVPDEG